jgi:hypothetical protein
MTEWVGNDLKNTATFATERSALYDAGGSTQTAVSIVGLTPPTETTTPVILGLPITTLNVTALPVKIPSGTTITIGTIPTTPTQALIVSSDAQIGDTVIHVSSALSSANQPAGTLVNTGVCPGNASSSMTVWCSTVLFPQLTPPDPTITREVTFSACPSSVTQAACISGPYVAAIIDYADRNTSGQLQCTPPSNNSSCGTSVTVRSWAVNGR